MQQLYRVSETGKQVLNSRVAHINARSEGGPRWNAAMTAAENRSYDSLSPASLPKRGRSSGLGVKQMACPAQEELFKLPAPAGPDLASYDVILVNICGRKVSQALPGRDRVGRRGRRPAGQATGAGGRAAGSFEDV